MYKKEGFLSRITQLHVYLGVHYHKNVYIRNFILFHFNYDIYLYDVQSNIALRSFRKPSGLFYRRKGSTKIYAVLYELTNVGLTASFFFYLAYIKEWLNKDRIRRGEKWSKWSHLVYERVLIDSYLIIIHSITLN